MNRHLVTRCPLTKGPKVPATKVMLSTIAMRIVRSVPLKVFVGTCTFVNQFVTTS